MILDAAKLQESSTHDCDICIVGSGPAGLTIANAVSRTSLQVCLLESGGLHTRRATKAQILADQFGVPIDGSKLRKQQFGGASNMWGGFSGRWFRARPLDPLDFEERSWIPDSGWPISFHDLVPYYEKACQTLKLLPLGKFDPAEYTGRIHPNFHNDVLRTAVFQSSRPIRFGQHHAERFKGSPNIKVFLNATVVNIEEAEDRAVVESLAFVTPNGKRHRVTARWFVLACGGLETPRLLLASKNKRSYGIGNEHDLVGRYFMQHPKGLHGLARLKQSTPSFPFISRVPAPGNISLSAGITFSDSIQRRYKVPNHCIMFLPVHSLHEGYASDVYRAINRAWYSNQGGGDWFIECLRRFRVRPAHLFFAVQNILGGSNSRRNFSILSHMEQTPNRESRVFLSPEKNEYGQWKLKINWRIGSLEKESLCRLHKLAKAATESCDAGSLVTNLHAHMDDWPISQDSAHYMGTTRMHRNPKRGVTDENCRVHSVENLYVSGSSVFPTAGYANPTLTIIALALRLADHLVKLERSRISQ
jgi:choline dehydrogenase-like flavoprotein